MKLSVIVNSTYWEAKLNSVCTAATDQSQNHVSPSESPSARLFQCARCFVQMKICRCCDRGHVYCSECSTLARKEARQGTAKRYQQSPQGRSNHAERQRRYRERQRVSSDKVTHKGILTTTHVIPMTRSRPVTQTLPEKPRLLPEFAIVCDFCAADCSYFLRRDFLQITRSPSKH